jgi:hypothetical protein
MIEKGLYYAMPEFAKMIQSCGGVWNDTKHRPIVCLIKSSENENLYWAIPMEKLNHRDAAQKSGWTFISIFLKEISVHVITTSEEQHLSPFSL